jgi:hypothetical protein
MDRMFLLLIIGALAAPIVALLVPVEYLIRLAGETESRNISAS